MECWQQLPLKRVFYLRLWRRKRADRRRPLQAFAARCFCHHQSNSRLRQPCRWLRIAPLSHVLTNKLWKIKLISTQRIQSKLFRSNFLFQNNVFLTYNKAYLTQTDNSLPRHDWRKNSFGFPASSGHCFASNCSKISRYLIGSFSASNISSVEATQWQSILLSHSHTFIPSNRMWHKRYDKSFPY